MLNFSEHELYSVSKTDLGFPPKCLIYLGNIGKRAIWLPWSLRHIGNRSAEALHELLGISAEEVARLAREGVVVAG